tara:strand:+ start:176 stop:1726 length:1551 start_codon:yes stop_codon:yes gene_type:complete
MSRDMLSISNNSVNLIQNNVKRVTINLENSLKSVASGRRINSAKDDASGLAISQRLASELKSNIVSLRNAADTQSFLDTADGAIDEIQKNLLRIRELSVQGKNGTLSTTDTSALNAEASQRIEEIDRITNSTTWANTKLLDGSVSNKQFQIGSSSLDTLSVSITNLSSSNLGLTGYSVDMSSGSSSISGTSSHDTLQGDGSSDTITGGVGNDTIIGGGGDDVAVFNGNQADFDIFSGAFTSLHVMGNHSYGVELGFEIVDGDGTVYRISHSPTNTQTHIVASELASAQFKDASGNNVLGHGFITSLGPNSQAAGTGAAIYIRKSDGSNFSVRRWSGTDSNTQFGFEGRIFDGYSELTTQRLIEGTSNGSKYTTVVGKYNGNIGYLNSDLYGIDRLSQVEWIKFNDGYYEVSSSTFSANPFTPTLASGDAISTIDSALDTISSERGKLGALSNRLNYIIANGSNLNLNLQKSFGKIIDTDYAKEITALTKNQIIQNASLSLLAQANAQKDVLITLIR